MKTRLALWICSLVGLTLGAPDNKGTEFHMVFLDNKDGSMPLEIHVSTDSQENATVLVDTPSFSPRFSESFTVSSGQVYKVEIPNILRMDEAVGFGTNDVVVTSDEEVVVYGVNKEAFSTDGFLAFPVDVLGMEYYAATWVTSGVAMIGLAGVENDTTVTFSLRPGVSVDVDGTPHQDTLTINLDRYQTYSLQSLTDLTGTHVVSDKPIAAFSGNNRTSIGPGTSEDTLVEQLMPVNTWGKVFALVPTPQIEHGDYVVIVASENDTQVSISSQTATNVTVLVVAGDSYLYEAEVGDYLYITADKPVQVVQLVLSQDAGSQDYADPAMIIPPPVDQFDSKYTFSAIEYNDPLSSGKQFTHNFLLVVPDWEKDGLILDGGSLPTYTNWTQFADSDFVGGVLEVAVGAHTIQHSSPIVTFGCYLYGLALFESYGYSAGLRMASINSECNSTVNEMEIGDGIDNDCDGRIDEEICDNQIDDDSDGLSDEDCVIGVPIDGNWTLWGDWSPCTCINETGAIQYRTRTCDHPAPVNDGLDCTGNSAEYQVCGKDCSGTTTSTSLGNSMASTTTVVTGGAVTTVTGGAVTSVTGGAVTSVTEGADTSVTSEAVSSRTSASVTGAEQSTPSTPVSSGNGDNSTDSGVTMGFPGLGGEGGDKYNTGSTRVIDFLIVIGCSAILLLRE